MRLRLARWLEVPPDQIVELKRAGVAELSDAVERALVGKHCLIVLDDVWDESQPQPFRRFATGGVAVLITTRKSACVEAFGNLLLPLSLTPMDQEHATKLLVASSGRAHRELEGASLVALVKMCAGREPRAHTRDAPLPGCIPCAAHHGHRCPARARAPQVLGAAGDAALGGPHVRHAHH